MIKRLAQNVKKKWGDSIIFYKRGIRNGNMQTGRRIQGETLCMKIYTIEENIFDFMLKQVRFVYCISVPTKKT
jgi:hypothetical protein